MHIVLYEPDIPWNTGNIGRTCVATGTSLHLVGPLGFSTTQKEVQRAGLDYWQKVDLHEHSDWSSFLRTVPSDAPFYFFSKKGKINFWEATFHEKGYLIFGCETKGIPDLILREYPKRTFHIPVEPDSVRSLNLSTAVGVVLYEALRQMNLSPSL